MFKVIIKSNAQSLSSYMYARLKKSWVIMALLSLVMCFGLLFEIAVPKAIGFFIDIQSEKDNKNNILAWILENPLTSSALLLGLLAVVGVSTFIYQFLFSKIEANDLANIRKLIWRQSLKVNFDFTAINQKMFFANFMQDSQMIAGLFSVIFLYFIRLILSIILIIGVMCSIHLHLTLIFWAAMFVLIAYRLRSDHVYEKLVRVHRNKNTIFLDEANQLAANGYLFNWAGQKNVAFSVAHQKLKQYLFWRKKSAHHIVKFEAVIDGISFVFVSGLISAMIWLVHQNNLSAGDALSLSFFIYMSLNLTNRVIFLWSISKRMRIAWFRITRTLSSVPKKTQYSGFKNTVKPMGDRVFEPFSDTLKNNLSLGAEFSSEELTQALQKFELLAELQSQKITLESDLSSLKSKLSLGQCQRLQMARRWLHGEMKSVSDHDFFALDTEKRKRILDQVNGGFITQKVDYRGATI